MASPVDRYRELASRFASTVVTQHYSASARETYTEREGDDPELIFKWLGAHRDAVLLRHA